MKSLLFISAGHNFTWDVLFGSQVFLALALLCFHRLYKSFSPFFQQEGIHAIERMMFPSSLPESG